MLKCDTEGVPYIVQGMNIVNGPYGLEIELEVRAHDRWRNTLKKLSPYDKIGDRDLVALYSSSYGTLSDYVLKETEDIRTTGCPNMLTLGVISKIKEDFIKICFEEQQSEIHRRLEKYYETHWDELK